MNNKNLSVENRVRDKTQRNDHLRNIRRTVTVDLPPPSLSPSTYTVLPLPPSPSRGGILELLADLSTCYYGIYKLDTQS